MNIIFKRKLGFIYDLCKVITCKTARRETWIDEFIHSGDESADLDIIETILAKLPQVDDKLYLLGYKDRKKGSILDTLFLQYANAAYGIWDSVSFVEYISDYNRLKNDVAKFYFNKEYSESILGEINDTSYSADIRTHLFEFFIFPESYTLLMKKEINSMIDGLDEYYDKHSSLILEKQETLHLEDILNARPEFDDLAKCCDKITECFISLPLIAKYGLEISCNPPSSWIILGYDYETRFSEEEKAPVNVADFGNAFGDKIRVQILELLVKHGELTLADLSKRIGVVNTIAIYHLDILKKENLLLQRNQGRKVLYCLNRRQITKGLDVIKTLCGMNL